MPRKNSKRKKVAIATKSGVKPTEMFKNVFLGSRGKRKKDFKL